ncbi:MAG: hypothetical protein H7A01_04980 [Hahellaceae bacterium]|nr:hypothetical protein [Hahellaceae bacterium]MCP5212773.1 hypothetical protein [Hahellaceae bacterium]
MKTVLTFFLLICSLHVIATPSAESTKYGGNSTPALSLPENTNTTLYRCNLITSSGQCREYQILSGAQDSLSDLQDGCKSMAGIFDQTECPAANAIAKCSDIVRNYNQPDVIYDNYYYRVEGLQLHGASLAYVCGELGGDLSQLSQ